MFGCFLRLIWMLMGPALALVMLFFAFLQGGGWFGAPDVLFAIMVAFCLAARWLDDPTETPSRQKYTAFGLACAGAVWLMTHLMMVWL